MHFVHQVFAACNPADPNNIFGCIEPPAGNIGGGNDPVAATGSLFTTFVRMALFGAALLVLIYLLWGGYDWISSGGEKEKLVKAQQKITQAIIGLIVVVLAFGIFGVIAGNMLGLVRINGGSLIFKLPTFNGQ